MTASIDHMPGKEVDVVQALPVYGSMFNSVGWTAIGCAVFLLLISPLLKKLMHGVR
jgi:POT family proton-dependent oligopeptide transporter